jgi:hypothetical protein
VLWSGCGQLLLLSLLVVVIIIVMNFSVVQKRSTHLSVPVWQGEKKIFGVVKN